MLNIIAVNDVTRFAELIHVADTVLLTYISATLYTIVHVYYLFELCSSVSEIQYECGCHNI